MKKAPFQIPDGGREMDRASSGPWISVVLLILTLPLLLFALGIGTISHSVRRPRLCDRLWRPHALRHRGIGLMIAALPGLFNRKMSGWRLLFYSQLVSIVYNLLSGNIIGGLLSA